MGVRALQARIECDQATLQRLWATHHAFNACLPDLLKLLFRMRRGELGRNSKERRLYQTIVQFILQNSQTTEYLLNSVSTKGWTPNSAKQLKATIKGENGDSVEARGDDWADEAAKLSAEGVLLFDKTTFFRGLPGHMRQMICRDAAAIMSGHDALTKNWESAHQDWLRRKEEWESDLTHQRYLALRPRFEAFETSAGGKATKRRGRWHLYLQWLRENPDLAAWRGCEAVVHPLTPEAESRIAKAKPWKRRSVEAEEFWKANPELRALDQLHGYYEREFVRRRKRKKNRDGFDHRPTFTLPDALRHPRWLVFNAPQTKPQGYRNLQLPQDDEPFGSIDLRLLQNDSEDDSAESDWVNLRLRVDPRLRRFRRVTITKPIVRGSRKGESTSKESFEFFDRHLCQWRPAEISGAKLIIRDVRLASDGRIISGAPYLVFTCSTESLPLTERAKKIEWKETGERTKTGKLRKSRKIPDGLISCAVDLGLRHCGFATIAEYSGETVRIRRSRSLWLQSCGGGPELSRIAEHKRELKRRRRLRGRPVAGEQSHIELQNHITHMGVDRFKKAARSIVNFALNVERKIARGDDQPLPRADIILVERMEGFVPDAERERGINRALAAWNRGQLVERLKQLAEDYGFKGRIFEIHPAGTSQVCSRCGELGRRYSIVRDETTRRPQIQFGWVEKLFACAACGYRANADHNASVNLHRKFLSPDWTNSFFQWSTMKDRRAKETRIHELDDKLLPALMREHRLTELGVDSPF